MSFALYEFSKICDIKIEDTIVIETGGVKNSKLSKSKIEIIEQLKKNLKQKCLFRIWDDRNAFASLQKR